MASCKEWLKSKDGYKLLVEILLSISQLGRPKALAMILILWSVTDASPRSIRP